MSGVRICKLAMVALAGAATASGSGHAAPLERGRMRVVVQGALSGVKEPKRVILKTQAEWEKLWKVHASPGPVPVPVPPAPKVDWSREMLVGAFMGSRSTGGYAVRIESVREIGGKLVVTVRERKPAPGDVVTQAFTSPCHVVAVKRSALPVSWNVLAAERR